MRKLAILLCLAVSATAFAAEQGSEDVLPNLPFKEGDTITFDQLEKLKDFLPAQFWENREFFFYEGMQLEVGPALRDYSEAEPFKAASEKFKGQSKIVADGAIEGYTAGRPFETSAIDCKGDPQAAAKIIWNFNKAWNGDGADSTWSSGLRNSNGRASRM